MSSKAMTMALISVVVTLLASVSVRGLPEDQDNPHAERIESLARLREELSRHVTSAMEAHTTGVRGTKHMAKSMAHVQDEVGSWDEERHHMNAEHLRELAHEFKKMDFANLGKFHLNDADFRHAIPKYDDLVQVHRESHLSHAQERDAQFHLEERMKAAQELTQAMTMITDEIRHSVPVHHVDSSNFMEGIDHARAHNRQNLQAHVPGEFRPVREHLRARPYPSHDHPDHGDDKMED